MREFLEQNPCVRFESENGSSLEAELQEGDRILNSADQNGIITGDMLFIKRQMLMILERPQEVLLVLRAALDRDTDHPQAAGAIHAVERWLEPRESAD